MMMQYNNPTTVSATCGVYSMSVQCFLGVQYLSTSTIVTVASSLLHRAIIINLQNFQVLSQVPFIKGKVWPFGNLTENNYNNHRLIM